MAWTAIVLVSTGELATAAVQNTQVLGNLNELRTGGLAIASQAPFDFVYASSASQLARLAAVASKSPRLNAAANAWEMTPWFPGELLKSNSGTDTNAAATNVDTVSISGLTAKDTLHVNILIGSITQQTAGCVLYNSTDGANVAQPDAAAAIVVDEVLQSTITVMQSQNSATAVFGRSDGYSNLGERSSFTSAAFTTNWTGSWTLALRHTGVTAGGTFRWRWTVCKIAGQV